MDVRSDPVRAALDQLLTLAGERAARDIVREIGRRSAQIELERVIVRRLAAQLLRERAPRWAIRDRLVSRGINLRTAYRVIDAVLSAGPRCDNSAPPMTNDLRSIPSPQSTAAPMTLTLKDLTAKREALQSQLTRIDVPGRRLAEANARAKHERLKSDGRDQKHQDVREEVQAAAQAASGARSALASAEFNAGPIQRELNELSQMLGGTEAVERSQRELDDFVQVVDAAVSGVKAAESAVGAMKQLIETEQAAFEVARTTAAANLLAAVKAGADASKVASPNLDKVATLELARISAEEELAAAKATLAAARQREAVLKQNLLVAQASVTALAHEFAFAAYTEALGAHMAAYWKAHRGQFFSPDSRGPAAAICSRLLGSEG